MIIDGGYPECHVEKDRSKPYLDSAESVELVLSATLRMTCLFIIDLAYIFNFIIIIIILKQGLSLCNSESLYVD